MSRNKRLGSEEKVNIVRKWKAMDGTVCNYSRTGKQ